MSDEPWRPPPEPSPESELAEMYLFLGGWAAFLLTCAAGVVVLILEII